MNEKPESKPTARDKLHRELREYAIISIYLFVCLGAVLLYRTAVLDEHGIDAWKMGAAVGKSLILGKFILIGQAMRIGERRDSSTVFRAIMIKALLFLVLLLVLSTIEEAIVARVHGHAIGHALAERFAVLQLLASSFVMFLILIPYFAFMEIDEAMGGGKLRKLLFSKNAG